MSSKQRMIDETYLLFAEFGEHFSLSQVTKSLGIKKQSVYNYFEKKDDLLLEMLNQEISKYTEEIDRQLIDISSLPLKEKLYEFGLNFISVNDDVTRIKARRFLSMIINADNMSTIKQKLEDNQLNYENYVLQLLTTGVKDGIIKECDLTFMNCFFFTFVRGLIDGSIASNPYPTTKEFYDKFYEEFWTMISLK